MRVPTARTHGPSSAASQHEPDGRGRAAAAAHGARLFLASPPAPVRGRPCYAGPARQVMGPTLARPSRASVGCRALGHDVIMGESSMGRQGEWRAPVPRRSPRGPGRFFAVTRHQSPRGIVDECSSARAARAFAGRAADAEVSGGRPARYAQFRLRAGTAGDPAVQPKLLRVGDPRWWSRFGDSAPAARRRRALVSGHVARRPGAGRAGQIPRRTCNTAWADRRALPPLRARREESLPDPKPWPGGARNCAPTCAGRDVLLRPWPARAAR